MEDTDSQEFEEETPLDLALQQQRTEIVHMLVARGAKLRTRGKRELNHFLAANPDPQNRRANFNPIEGIFADPPRRATIDTYSHGANAFGGNSPFFPQPPLLYPAAPALGHMIAPQRSTAEHEQIQYRKNELRQKEEDCRRLSAAVQDKEIEFERVYLRVQAMESHAAALQHQVQESEQNLARLGRAHQELYNAQQTLSQKYSRLQEDYEEKAARTESAEKRLKELEWKVVETAHALAKLTNDQEAEAYRATLRARETSEAERHLASLQNQVQESEQKLTQTRRAQQELQNAKQALSRNFSSLLSDHNEKAARTATIEKQLAELEEKMEDKSSRLLALDLELQDQMTTLILLKQTIETQVHSSIEFDLKQYAASLPSQPTLSMLPKSISQALLNPITRQPLADNDIATKFQRGQWKCGWSCSPVWVAPRDEVIEYEKARVRSQGEKDKVQQALSECTERQAEIQRELGVLSSKQKVLTQTLQQLKETRDLHELMELLERVCLVEQRLVTQLEAELGKRRPQLRKLSTRTPRSPSSPCCSTALTCRRRPSM